MPDGDRSCFTGLRQTIGNMPDRRQWPRIHEQKKSKSFERINSIRETNGSFDSYNSCKRLVSSRLHELHESKLPFVSRIEFIRSKLSNFLLMYPGSVKSQRRVWPDRCGAGGPDTAGRRPGTTRDRRHTVIMTRLALNSRAESPQASTCCSSHGRSADAKWDDRCGSWIAAVPEMDPVYVSS